MSESYDNFLKYPTCPLKYVIVRGVGGVPDFFVVDWNPNIFVTEEPTQNFRNLMTTPSGDLNKCIKKRK
jgi:hypothetical protein